MRFASLDETVYDERRYLRRALADAPATTYIPFAPDLNPQDRLVVETLSRQLVEFDSSLDRVRATREALARVDGRAFRLRAALSVLLDLLRHEYRIRWNGSELEVAAATLADWPGTASEYKAFQRRHLLQERDLQLNDPSVRRFITKMERKRRHLHANVSILDLIADGEEILRRLDGFNNLGNADFSILPIQPYVQEVATREADSHTGLLLQDIWRYFRHTWALPYNSTPGRNMQFLVRDAAQPFHPVIGIVGLGSAVIQITPRDDFLGWTLRSVERCFEPALVGADSPDEQRKVAEFTQAVQESLRRARAEISHVGICHHNARPTPELLESVSRVANSLAEKSRATVTDRRSRSLRGERDTPLYKKKRAQALLRILRAQATLEHLPTDPRERLKSLLRSEAGRAALSVALKEQKKRHVGSSIMDIVVCGAIQPYASLLGGKLVAMLAASPGVISSYERRYKGAISEIASAMRGAPVNRPAKLVFLGTTSLYESHSSQYDRIRLPASLGGRRFEELGKTEGFASVQFSRETRSLLERVSTRRRGRRVVTHKFGEGVNPKLRSIAIGLADLGLDGRLLKYSSRRIVYGVRLAANAREYLLGMAESPDYSWRLSPRDAEEEIARYWLERWALPRSRRPETRATLPIAKEHVPVSLRPARAEVNLLTFEMVERTRGPPHEPALRAVR